MLPEAFFLTGIAAAAVSDVRERRIPNWLNASLFVAGVGTQVISRGAAGAGDSLGGSAVGLLLLILPFLGRWMGAGDVKLAAAIGSWLGPIPMLVAGLLGLVVGGLLSVVWLWRGDAALRRSVRVNLELAFRGLRLPTVEPRVRAQTVPLAVGLSTAATVVFVWNGGIR